MAEFHEEMIGRTKAQNHQSALDKVNYKYNQKIKEKSFFDSKSSIEKERQKAIEQVNEDFYGRSSGFSYLIE